MISLSDLGFECVAGGEGAVFERRPFGLRFRADHLRDVGYATSRECARPLFPQGCTVTARLVVARRIAEVSQCAPVDVARIQHRLKGKIAVCIHLDGDLLADQAGFVAAAEDEHFDRSSASARLKLEAAYQFPRCEIVGLIDQSYRVGCV